MRIAATKPLFAWEDLEDSPTLKTIKQLLEVIPDQTLLDSRNDVHFLDVYSIKGFAFSIFGGQQNRLFPETNDHLAHNSRPRPPSGRRLQNTENTVSF